MLHDEVVTTPPKHFPNTFQPYRHGVGITFGAEAIVHACQNFIGDASLTNRVLLKIDLKVVNHPANSGGLQKLKLNYNF